ncbi:Ig-like domain-containing protein [Methanosphaera sp. ISO3-F5]|uniref:Ig-like domain-containing protein n=1 Tax=Methanosphaera sp. ISO3-F5 TaxID=1452353 RepID=UPI002B25F8E8|nr:Ig-like domain-containing protein [Methanosphaera sp. ISO3-F5]WQH64104.1 Ig-like domain-containing protein [Methanosphaera sp. ISO3-F5]
MKTKTIRPKKARSQGEILPHIDRLTEYSHFEDYHTKRSNGTDTKFKDTTVKTINLNGNWIDVGISLKSITPTPPEEWVALHPGTIVVHLYKLENGEPVANLANEKIDIYIRGECNTVTTNATGFASVSYEPTHLGKHEYSIEYNGNSKKGYKPCDPITGSFSVRKLKVKITHVYDLTQQINSNIYIFPHVQDEFDNDMDGVLELYREGVSIDVATLANGQCSFIQNFNLPNVYDYLLEYKGNSLVDSATKEFTITVVGLDAAIITRTTNYEVVQGNTLEFKVRVVDANEHDILVDGGSVQISENNIVIGTYDLDSNREAIIQYTNNTLGNHDLKIDYIEKANGIYMDTSKTVHVNVIEKYTPHIVRRATTYTTESGKGVELRVRVLNDDDEAVDSGTVTFKVGDDVYGRVAVDTSSGDNKGLATFTFVEDYIASYYVDIVYSGSKLYKSVSTQVEVTVGKITTEINISDGDIIDYITDSGSKQIKVTNANNNAVVNEGNLVLQLKQEKQNVTQTIGTYNLANTTGNLTINRQNINLDSLFTAMKNTGYLYYTGYTLIATYKGTSKYKASSKEKPSMNLHVRRSGIYAVPVIQDSANYNISSAYPTVPDNYYGAYTIRVDHDDTNGILSTVIVGGRIYNGGINTPATLGTVKKGQTIYFVTEYKALRLHDSDKNKTETQIENYVYEDIGGLNTELHYKINDGNETDTANAYINGTSSLYDGPLYTKFTVPNTCQVGDTIQLIFYIGKNAGYYHYLEGEGSDSFGYRYKVQFEVVE